MNKIYCSNCGTLIPKTDNFCTNCGAAQHGEESAVYRTSEPMVDVAGGAEVPKPATTGLFTPIPRRHFAGMLVVSMFFSNLSKTAILIPLLAIGIYIQPLLVAPIVIAYLLLSYLIAQLIYNYMYFSIDENGLQTESGIIYKKQVSIGFERIQNVNIERTFFDRVLGLSRMNIETAGSVAGQIDTSTATVETIAEAQLPGVTFADAKIIHDLLIDGTHLAKQ